VQVKNREGAQKWVFVRAEVRELPEELKMLVAITYSEAGVCHELEQRAVAHSIINRVSDAAFAGNNLKETISYENQYGKQYVSYMNNDYKKAMNYTSSTPVYQAADPSIAEQKNMERALEEATNAYYERSADNTISTGSTKGAVSFHRGDKDTDSNQYHTFVRADTPPIIPADQNAAGVVTATLWAHSFWIHTCHYYHVTKISLQSSKDVVY
jgi:hypothetical protein